MVVFIMMIIWFLLSELDSRFFFLNGGRNVLVQAIVLRQGEGRRTKGGSRLLARTAGWVVALFVGTEEKVEETHLGTRFLIFQERWDLVGLSVEHRRHERWRCPSRA